MPLSSYTAPVRTTGETGQTADLNAAYQQISDLTERLQTVGGIDYTAPVTLSGSTTLEVSTSYRITGAGYPVTLPDPTAANGRPIFIMVAANATGLYAVNGIANLTLYAGESIHLRATADGWKKTGGELLPMVARLETTTGQQNSYTGEAIQSIPLSVRPSLIGPEALANAATGTITIQRNGRAVFDAGGVLAGLSNSEVGYTILLQRVRPNGEVGYPVVVFCVNGLSGGSYLAVCPPISAALPVLAGESYTLVITPGGGSCRLAGQHQTNVFFLNFTELV